MKQNHSAGADGSVTATEHAKVVAQLETTKQQLTDARAQTGQILVEQAEREIMAELAPAEEFADIVQMAVLQHLSTVTNKDGQVELAVIDPKTGDRRFSADGPMNAKQLTRQVLQPKFASVLGSTITKGSDQSSGDRRRGSKQPVVISQSDASDLRKYQEAREEARARGVEVLIDKTR